MQRPTCTDLRIRNTDDANRVLHAARTGRLPVVTRRLDDEERLALRSGCVYAWEERSNNPLEVTGQEIQRFTEGRSWGPSRAREDFLLYFEKEGGGRTSIIHRTGILNSQQMVKQTYSVNVLEPDGNLRKWHLNAYFTHDTVDTLITVDAIPLLRDLVVPDNMYVPARANGQRRTTRSTPRRQSVEDAALTLQPQPQPVATRATPPLPPGTITFMSQYHPQPSFYAPQPPRDTSRPLFADDGANIRLAPLEYLQNIPPRVRNPIDDQVLRSFRYPVPM